MLKGPFQAVWFPATLIEFIEIQKWDQGKQRPRGTGVIRENLSTADNRFYPKNWNRPMKSYLWASKGDY